MLGASWLNIGSLAFGLIAWILPIVSLTQRNRTDRGNRAVLSAASAGACAASLCMQIFYTDHLVKIEDWSALMDTSREVALVSALLLAVTIILNGMVFATDWKKTKG